MKQRAVFAVFALLVLLLSEAACASGQPVTAVPTDPLTGMPQGTDGYPWWNDSVFYEIFVRSFADSDGDGIGDFNGITDRLDYLNDGDPETATDLGVTGLWLMPINSSPSYHGYDVTDYYSVEPDYGSMADFRRLLNEAHRRGMRVILDLVLNHTSAQHPWFLHSWDAASATHSWYIWSDTDPAFRGPWGQPVWHPSHGQYYYALFWDQMPDLNYEEPAVTRVMENVVRFWLGEVGVDGFRLDAVRHLIESGPQQSNTDATHAWLRQLRAFYNAIDARALTVGEVAGEPVDVMASYTLGDELDLTFDFGLASAFVSAARGGSAGLAGGQLGLTYKIMPPLQFATFLTNHDQPRLMTELRNNPDKVKVAASLLLTAPGVPFIYYGEEIGLQGGKPDELIRRPMQWSGEPQAGFTSGSAWIAPGPDWESLNVAAESADPGSILAHYRNLIAIRNQHAALRVGDLSTVGTGSRSLYAILRISSGEAILVLVNLTGTPIADYGLSVQESSLAPGTYSLLPILGTGPFAALTSNAGGGFDDFVPAPEIPPYATLILQLQAQNR